METIQYFDVIDKSGWLYGPWSDEPDKVQWQDEATGLPCLAVRSPTSGALCGYVGVPPGHPWHGAHYDRLRWNNPDAEDKWDYSPNVHGGTTYAGACGHGDDPAKGICHIPGPGEPDDVWWLGFDCAHAFDYMPAIEATLRNIRPFGDERFHSNDVYRDATYVKAQVEELARQAMLAIPYEAEDE